MSSAEELSAAATTETDEFKRLDYFTKAVKAMVDDWHNSPKWTQSRTANHVLAPESFRKSHHAFACVYKNMFTKIIDTRPSHKWTAQDTESLERGAESKRKQLQLAASKSKPVSDMTVDEKRSYLSLIHI